MKKEKKRRVQRGYLRSMADVKEVN